MSTRLGLGFNPKLMFTAVALVLPGALFSHATWAKPWKWRESCDWTEPHEALMMGCMVTTMGTTTTFAATVFTYDSIKNLFGYAKDDAAAFIASDGDIRGAQFERAWRSYRADLPHPDMDEMAFAHAVLAAG
ncbi:DUF2388 domain-containing protein [Pseudomonas protegens]|uniref:DUF2388 domain-containing protein n=1 Tax=Pseudomonas protegens TaxID=380021 RepID=UPI000FF17EC0|nr:DUF2388 domain-containing protein [Pseudomonas protegens]ROL84706.1 hypothetical protein BK639_29700 [Pseudomonas protegens]ROM00569.1 hypothetical protein BK641_21115 [Pseudomonas protegens]ROM09776.1 hypothetical protein BK642_11150 [Pseudomonas protegens]WOE82230.1 DUF2388 domain-containing protein [Pseudomonas protegens]